MIKRPPRKFLPEDFSVTEWKNLEPLYQELLNRELQVLIDLEKLLRDRSELEAVLEEDFAWRYIKTNSYTDNEKYKSHFVGFIENIQPHLAIWGDKLNKKIVQSAFFKLLPDDPYLNFKRNLETSVKIFRDTNVPLFTEIETWSQKFGSLNGAMTITHKGEELTLQAAAQKLESQDRVEREHVYRQMTTRRLHDSDALDEILDVLVAKRHQVALNAGFKNFRDYQFAALGRFDYAPDDCKRWHDLVAEYFVPLQAKIQKQRANKLKLKLLKPWDLAVEPSGLPALKPFTSGQELLNKTKLGFKKLDPSFSHYLATMEALNHFDLESRKGKAPGGFNYPLYEIGAPFIFMNAVGTQRDLETMVHEGGHAIHSFLSHNLALNEFKSTPAEVAELASMSMELISMDVWDEFYRDESTLARAKQQKIEDCVVTLPWVAVVDKFQHWLYKNPNHTRSERRDEWVKINQIFSTGLVDYSDFPLGFANSWQKQMHIFEVPFYYIEYGFAQMGALSLWKNWQSNSAKTLQQYKAFMKLGYTKTIPEIYATAGIKFDFSDDYIKTLAAFCSLS